MILQVGSIFGSCPGGQKTKENLKLLKRFSFCFGRMDEGDMQKRLFFPFGGGA